MKQNRPSLEFLEFSVEDRVSFAEQILHNFCNNQFRYEVVCFAISLNSRTSITQNIINQFYSQVMQNETRLHKSSNDLTYFKKPINACLKYQESRKKIQCMVET